MSVKVTVGLCVKNSEKEVRTALESVVKQDFPHELMKLVVVDEVSTDKTLSVVRNFVSKIDIKTEIFSSGGKGLGASRQIVVDNAEGDYIVWVDDDLVLKRDFVRKHVEFMEKNPSVGAARPTLTQIGKTLIDTLEAVGMLLAKPNPESIGTVGTIYRLKAMKQVGGFDINIKGAGEDIDISLRMKESGWALRNSSSESPEYYYKYPPTTWKVLWNRYFWYGYGEHFLFHKYETQKLRWLQLPPLALWIGFNSSRRIYQITHKKMVFLLALHYFFRSIAHCFGFLRAHLDGYGHFASNEG